MIRLALRLYKSQVLTLKQVPLLSPPQFSYSSDLLINNAEETETCSTGTTSPNGKISRKVGPKTFRYKPQTVLHNRPETDRNDDITNIVNMGEESEENTFGKLADGRQEIKRSRRKSKSDKIVVGHEQADNFGLLATDDVKEETVEKKLVEMDLEYDEEDEIPHMRLSEFGRKHTPLHYGRKIEKLAKRGKIYEAIEMLEVKMIKEDRVMPVPYVFTVLIGALGRVGYTYKAFKLFNKMKKMGLEPEEPTYTALFNACSNSPPEFDGLERAKKLHLQLKEKEIDMNRTTYNALIKAYGMQGDLMLAFSAADEMIQSGLPPDGDTYAQLLIACISDKKAGLKHAIEVWRRMRKRKVTLATYHYNLLLKAVRDCGLGEAEFANQLVKQVSQQPAGLNIEEYEQVTALAEKEIEKQRQKLLQIQTSEVVEEEQHEERMERIGAGVEDAQIAQTGYDIVPPQKLTSSKGWWQHDLPVTSPPVSPVQAAPVQDTQSHTVSALNQYVPNLLNPRAKVRGVVRLAQLDTAVQRLALLGGLPGILRHMNKDDVKPDVKTYMQLISLIPDSQSAEEDLLASMTAHRVTPDMGVLNMLIRRRCLRRNYSAAKQLVGVASQLGLAPDIVTFGCLAMGCRQKADGLALLQDMDNIGMTPNVEIFNILAFQSHLDFSYKLELLRTMKKLKVKPDEQFIRKVEKSVKTAIHGTVKAEKDSLDDRIFVNESYKKDFGKFMRYYKGWLLSMDFARVQHPWEQFRQPSPESEQDHISTPIY